MTDWLIIGASGHGRSLAAVIRGRGERVAALSDQRLEQIDRPSPPGFDNLDGTAPELFLDDLQALDYAQQHSLGIALGIGANSVRTRLAAQILARPELRVLATPLIARSATVDHTAGVGALSQVLEHAHIGPTAVLGEAVIVNTAAVVEHDAVVGDGVHLAPAAVLLGAARVGAGVMLGSGARVLPGLEVGAGANLGAGAVAVSSLAGMTTYIGVPARPMTSRKASL